MREKGILGKLWEILSPILLYELLTILYGELLQLLTGGQNQAAGTAMWLLTLENFLMLPIFWWLYRQDRRKGAYGRQGQVKRQSMGASDVFWILVGAVCLSRGINYFLSLTPLPHWFSGYEAASEAIYGCSPLSQIAASVISAPLLEEVLMRGLFYGRLKELTGSPKGAMIGSALVFGLFHGNVVQGVYAFLMGVFFARAYEAYQLLLPSVLAHMAANSASVLAGQISWSGAEGLGMPFYYLRTAVLLLVGIFCQKRLFQKHPNQPSI